MVILSHHYIIQTALGFWRSLTRSKKRLVFKGPGQNTGINFALVKLEKQSKTKSQNMYLFYLSIMNTIFIKSDIWKSTKQFQQRKTCVLINQLHQIVFPYFIQYMHVVLLIYTKVTQFLSCKAKDQYGFSAEPDSYKRVLFKSWSI